MRVLFIAPQPFFRIRGTPINVRNVVSALADDGHEVDLLCYPFGDPVDLPGVRILRCARFPGIRDVKVGPSAAKIPMDMLLLFKAIGLCFRRRYQVIHAVEEAGFFAVWLKRIFRTRLVYDMDSVISDQLAYSGTLRTRFLLQCIERMERGVMKQADFVLTVCASLSEAVQRICPGAQVVQIEDAPLEVEFAPAPELLERLKAEWNPEARPLGLYTGNLEAYQGLGLMVEALPEILRQHPDFVFLVVGGSGTQLEDLKQQAQKLGVAGACQFSGLRPMEEMSAFMALADMLLSPRISGTNTALKIYSYMQSGTPIVATDLETHTQVLDESCACLVPPEPSALAQGVCQLLDAPDQARELGRKSKERVDTQYSLAAFRAKVQKAYGEAFPSSSHV